MQQTSEQKQNKIQKNKGGFSMFKKMKHMKNEKGLTLVELLAVIVILAIVAAIAVPAIGNIINNTRDKAVLSDIQQAVSSAKIARADGSCTTLCKGSEFEFSSDKIADVGTSKNEDIEITFDDKGVATIITVVLEGNLNGGKIYSRVDALATYTAAAAASGSNPATKAKITGLSESELNQILGGN